MLKSRFFRFGCLDFFLRSALGTSEYFSVYCISVDDDDDDDDDDGLDERATEVSVLLGNRTERQLIYAPMVGPTITNGLMTATPKDPQTTYRISSNKRSWFFLKFRIFNKLSRSLSKLLSCKRTLT